MAVVLGGGGGGGIKSIQRGTLTMGTTQTHNVTISSVDTSKAVTFTEARGGAFYYDIPGTAGISRFRVAAAGKLTGATTLQITAGQAYQNVFPGYYGAQTTLPTVEWQVVEYE